MSDNTLRGTNQRIRELCAEFSICYGLRLPSEAEFRRLTGKKSEELIQGLFPGVLNAWELWKKFVLPEKIIIPPFPGVIASLIQLHKANLLLGLVTNATSESVALLLESYLNPAFLRLAGITDPFLFIHTPEECVRPKPC